MNKFFIILILIVEVSIRHELNRSQTNNQNRFICNQKDNVITIDSIGYDLNIINIKEQKIYPILDTLFRRTNGLFDSTIFNRHVFYLSFVDYNDSSLLYARSSNLFRIDTNFCIGVLNYANKIIIINSSSEKSNKYFCVDNNKKQFYCYKYYIEDYEFLYPTIHFDRKYLISNNSFVFITEKKYLSKLRHIPNDAILLEP